MSPTRMLLLALALVTSIAPALVARPEPGSGSGGRPAGTIKFEGRVTAVNVATGQVGLMTRSGPAVVVAGPTTRIERNGVRVPLSALRVGDRGQAIAYPNGAAVKIETLGP